MIRTKISGSAKKLVYLAAVLGAITAALLFIAKINTANAGPASAEAKTAALTPDATFPADAPSLGAIPDGPAACNAFGGNRDVTFTVSGMTAPLTGVSVNLTLAPAHTWAGDVDVRLRAPGGAPEHVIFARTGAATATAAGDSSDVAGPYDFIDSAPAAPTWWAAAAAEATGAAPVPPGSYRSSTAGEVAGGGANTVITTTFAGLTTPQINGVWTLRFRDHCSADTGSVSAATLTLATALPQQNHVDFDGNGRTDFVTVRNTGGGPSGQLTWFGQLNGGAGTTFGALWGIATDFYVPEDYDGDNKTDFAVWRPEGATATWYVLRSSDGAVDINSFGQSGDTPRVVGDYDNDGKADLAVYRAGQNAGDISSWWYRKSTVGGAGCTAANCAVVLWGQNGDFPAPGDYDGDGKRDFVVQRNFGGGMANFWMRFATGATSNNNLFGTPTDNIVPGDYDGDGKTDLAVSRGSGGALLWFVRRSTDGGTTYATFGASATDFYAQGDYDGDGKTDFAIWRPDIVDGGCRFWYLGSTSGSTSVAFGKNGDAPVANYNRF